MNVIAADIGNSTTKLLLGESDDCRFVSEQLVIRGDDTIQLDLPSADCFWALCSVSKPRCQRLVNWIEHHRPADRYHEIVAGDISLKTAVANRDATGRDRLVAAYMAASLADENSPFIVIDAGTAVTIDFIREDRTFMGGVIYPGATTQLRYLSAATDALPNLADHQDQFQASEIFTDVIGADTQSAIAKGVFHSQLASVTTIVAKMVQLSGRDCEVFATGGGIERLKPWIPDAWNIVPNLVLQGAFSIGSSLLEASTPGAE